MITRMNTQVVFAVLFVLGSISVASAADTAMDITALIVR